MGKEESQEGKGLMPSAFLVAAVAMVMVAGMVLRSEPPVRLPSRAGSASPAPALPLGSTIAPETAPAPPEVWEEKIEKKPALAPSPARPPTVDADPVLVKLAARVEGDCGRLAKARGRWTAQLLVACKPETVERVLGLAHDASALYVLPAHVNDDACFRVCFGSYATSKEAALAADLPQALRGKEKIGPVEIAKVLP